MWSTILPPAILAVASGFAYLAYKHPKGFRRIGSEGLSISIGILAVVLAINLTIIFFSLNRIDSELAASTKADEAKTIAAIAIPAKMAADAFSNIRTYGIPVVVACIYFWVLLRLPSLTKEEKVEQPENEKP